MNNQKEFEKLNTKHSLEEITVFSLFLLNKINSIADNHFQPWTDNPKEFFENSAQTTDMVKAKERIKQYRDDEVSALNTFQLSGLLSASLSGASPAGKSNFLTKLIGNLFNELDSEKVPIFIVERMSRIEKDEDFFRILPEIVGIGHDRIILAKLLLEKESEETAFNEDWLENTRIYEEQRNTQNDYTESEPSNCSLCEQHPCSCSDPQHNS